MSILRAISRSLLVSSGVMLLACSGASHGPTPQDSRPVGSDGAQGVAGSTDAMALCAPKSDASLRGKAIDSLARGEGKAATDAFRAAVAAHPDDLASHTLFIAAGKRQEMLSREVEAALRDVAPIQLRLGSSPSFSSNAVEPRAGADAARLKKASEAKNLIVDDADWLKKNGLRSPASFVTAAQIPEHLPNKFQGFPLARIFDHGDHQIGVYGPSLVVASSTSAPLTYTFAVELPGEHPQFAQLTGSTLLVQTGPGTGARPQAARPVAALYAFDASTGALRWASEQAVANATNFETTRDHVVTGFGGSAQADHLVLLDLANGKTLQKIPLKSAASMILQKDDRLFVRSYDVDYVFSWSSAPTAQNPPDLPPAKDRNRAFSPEMRCALDAAVAATDRRDLAALKVGVDQLRRAKAHRTLLGSFEGLSKFLEQQSQNPGIDLTTVKPVRMTEPPWEAKLFEAAAPPPTTSPKLVRISAKADGVWKDPRGAYRADLPWQIAPVEKGRLPPGARVDIPSQYGAEDLRVIIPSGDRLLLVYGGRYLAITKGNATEAVLDLETYRHPPKVNPQWKEFAVGDVTYAQVDGDVVYVANGGGSYAKEMGGHKGFVSAISLKNQKLLWRSPPLVHGSGPFGIRGDFLVTGYGFTDEPDHLFLLKKESGTVAAKATLESAPGQITLEGNRIHVVAYGHKYEYELK